MTHTAHAIRYRWDRRKWVRYLRALDARDAGVSLQQIGDVLHPEDDPDTLSIEKARYTLRRASKMRGGRVRGGRMRPGKYLKLIGLAER